MPTPLLQKIDCIELYVPDLEAAIAFYRDGLGHALVWRTENSAGLKMAATDSEILLQTERKGLKVDILVQSADEAAAAFEKAGGRVVVAPFDIQIGRCVVVKDPFEHELVLLDMSKGRLITDDQGQIIGNEPPG